MMNEFRSTSIKCKLDIRMNSDLHGFARKNFILGCLQVGASHLPKIYLVVCLGVTRVGHCSESLRLIIVITASIWHLLC